jgi:uncharacterized cupredoxin-like copper-binding protein
MSYTSIDKLEVRPFDTMRSLIFYKEEINILQQRLDEIAGKNTSFEARQGIEHFQNQFVLQKNNIDELKHKVNLFYEKLSNDTHSHSGQINDVRIDEQNVLQEEFLILEKVIKDMRQEFNAFLKRWQ